MAQEKGEGGKKKLLLPISNTLLTTLWDIFFHEAPDDVLRFVLQL